MDLILSANPGDGSFVVVCRHLVAYPDTAPIHLRMARRRRGFQTFPIGSSTLTRNRGGRQFCAGTVRAAAQATPGKAVRRTSRSHVWGSDAGARRTHTDHRVWRHLPGQPVFCFKSVRHTAPAQPHLESSERGGGPGGFLPCCGTGHLPALGHPRLLSKGSLGLCELSPIPAGLVHGDSEVKGQWVCSSSPGLVPGHGAQRGGNFSRLCWRASGRTWTEPARSVGCAGPARCSAGSGAQEPRGPHYSAGSGAQGPVWPCTPPTPVNSMFTHCREAQAQIWGRSPGSNS